VAAAVIRHCRTAHLVIDTMVPLARGSLKPPPSIVSTRADESFFRGVEPARRGSHTAVVRSQRQGGFVTLGSTAL